MAKPKFRIVSNTGSSTENRRELELDRITGVADPKTVDVSLRQFVPLVVDAAKSNRSWLSDFADDTVRIDADLYDVLLAYQQFKHKEAA